MVEAGWQPDPSQRHELRWWDGSAWTEKVADGGALSDDPLPQAAWLADPAGRHPLRFWDGAQWTEHVSDGTVASVDPLPVVAEEQPAVAAAPEPAAAAPVPPVAPVAEPVVVAAAGPAPTAATPPAWAPDPTGRHELRYWDGEQWTDHVSSRGVVATDPLVPAPAPVTAVATPVAEPPVAHPPVVAPTAEPVAAPEPAAAAEPATDGASDAGWRPDPLGRHSLRWWDGTRWTDDVHDEAPAPSPAPSDAPAPAAAPAPTTAPTAPTTSAPAPAPTTEGAAMPAAGGLWNPSVTPATGVTSGPVTTMAPDAATGPVATLVAPDVAPPAVPAAQAVPPVAEPATDASALAEGLSGLLWLSADEVVKSASVLTGLKPPCCEARVSRQAAAGVLVAAAIWDLYLARSVDLFVTTKQGRLGRTDTRVDLEVLRTDGPGWGVGILATAGSGRHDVRELVERWFGRMMSDPYGYVIGFAEAELVARGCLTYTERRGVGGFLATVAKGRAATEADCARIEELRPERDAAVARWRSAVAGEVLRNLVEECEEAVRRRELHDS